MKIQDIKSHPKYWQLHKEIYFDELDTLDFEIKDIVTNSPDSGTARRFNKSVERMISERIQESNNHSDIELF